MTLAGEQADNYTPASNGILPGRLLERVRMPSQDESCRRRVVFSGNVQGVGFRYRTSHVAQEFAVVGFVRNLSDGRVELVAEGEPAEVTSFVDTVHGEMSGYIHDHQDETSPATGEFDRFEIRA